MITYNFKKANSPYGISSYRSYYMEPLAGSGMFTSTHSNLVAEIGQELRGLECHIKELEGERDEVGRSKRSYEAEKRRAVAKIQKL